MRTIGLLKRTGIWPAGGRLPSVTLEAVLRQARFAQYDMSRPASPSVIDQEVWEATMAEVELGVLEG
eukprot:986353-Karenia_brevis.AAC.1